MLSSLVAALEQKRQAERPLPCEKCGSTTGLLLVSHDRARCLCLPCFAHECPGMYVGVYRWCQEHPAEERR